MVPPGKLKRPVLQPFSANAIKERPQGLAFSPSEWRWRFPVLVLAVIGCCIATYLALYQWAVMPNVWEPFFGSGSKRVLHSSISRILPVPDAFLGALGYLADIVTGSLGGNTRWRTMPWAVMIYGATVVFVGATALVLAAFQPLLFHAGCTLCLASAFISICIVWLARHEVSASFGYLRRARAAEKLESTKRCFEQ